MWFCLCRMALFKGIHHSKRYFSNSRRFKIAIFNIFQTLQIKENTDQWVSRLVISSSTFFIIFLGLIFAHVSIYLGQLVIFFCHGGTKLSFSRLSDGEPFLYCNSRFGLLLFKAYQFFKRIQRILKKLFKKIIFPGNILCTIQCKLPSFWGL